MKVYITKNVLRDGIRAVVVILSQEPYNKGTVRTSTYPYELYKLHEWHVELDNAIEAAGRIRKEQISYHEKEIEKLSKLKIKLPTDLKMDDLSKGHKKKTPWDKQASLVRDTPTFCCGF